MSWKTNRSQWLDKHPYPEKGFDSEKAAEAYCAEIRKVHTDSFEPFESINRRWYVRQDVPHV